MAVVVFSLIDMAVVMFELMKECKECFSLIDMAVVVFSEIFNANLIDSVN